MSLATVMNNNDEVGGKPHSFFMCCADIAIHLDCRVSVCTKRQELLTKVTNSRLSPSPGAKRMRRSLVTHLHQVVGKDLRERACNICSVFFSFFFFSFVLCSLLNTKDHFGEEA